jgi:hypothetical protein
MFVEVMERCLRERTETPPATSETSSRGATAAAGTTVGPPTREKKKTAKAALPWQKMAAELGWTVDQVQTHAFLYFAALCEREEQREGGRRGRATMDRKRSRQEGDTLYHQYDSSSSERDRGEEARHLMGRDDASTAQNACASLHLSSSDAAQVALSARPAVTTGEASSDRGVVSGATPIGDFLGAVSSLSVNRSSAEHEKPEATD